MNGDEAMQMEFADVVDSEHLAGDQTYTAWVAAGRPTLTPEDKQPRTTNKKEAS